jgi:hypothetical protein
VNISDRSVIYVTIFNILKVYRNFLKKYGLALHLVEMDTAPDPNTERQALDADPDLDPSK